MEKPLVNKEFLLEKYPGKGGWTYAIISERIIGKGTPFGWVKVKGSIDGVEIHKYSLMPLKDGRMFLPVNAVIRKKIKKEAGDMVRVVLYVDLDPLHVPEEFSLCLEDAPEALRFFRTLKENEQMNFICWIYAAKTEETQTKRMAATITLLAQGRKFYEAGK